VVDGSVSRRNARKEKPLWCGSCCSSGEFRAQQLLAAMRQGASQTLPGPDELLLLLLPRTQYTVSQHASQLGLHHVTGAVGLPAHRGA
jgi:hypothetical protein